MQGSQYVTNQFDARIPVRLSWNKMIINFQMLCLGMKNKIWQKHYHTR